MKKIRKEKNKKPIKKTGFFSLGLNKVLLHIFVLALLAGLGFVFFNFQFSQAQGVTQVVQLLPKDLSFEKNIQDSLESSPAAKSILDLSQADLGKIAFEKKAPILMYHYIENDNKNDSTLRRNLTIVPQKFEEQIKWLADNGYQTLTLSTYFDKIANQETIPEKTVLITVDDGYRDFFENAAPILAKYNQTATVFVITNSIDLPNFLTWDQIKTLSDQGIEFGSHSLTHPNLTKLSDSKLQQEVSDSKNKLEEELNAKVNFFCYPSGNFDDRVEKIVKAAGYKGALTTLSGYNVSNKNLYEMRRIRISRNLSLENFSWMIENAYK